MVGAKKAQFPNCVVGIVVEAVPYTKEC
jgi:hypothetical protein